MVIWRITDGKPGHDHQSQGLIKAISKYISTECHDLPADKLTPTIINFILKRFPPGKSLPGPDLVIGAGHATHLNILCAQYVYGGKSVVLMKPTLPVSVFDFCLIPEHDHPAPADNIITTRGAINLMTPSLQQDKNLGIILIGGPSRHFNWDETDLLEQISNITIKSGDVFWQITDSPRTPESTRAALKANRAQNVNFQSCKSTSCDWLVQQLQKCGYAWVTADSISMIYEALTAGTATGILHVPQKKPGKISHNIDTLGKEHLITFYNDWYKGRALSPPEVVLNEADRCAKLIVEKLADAN